MLEKNKLEILVSNSLKGSTKFVVDIHVSPTNVVDIIVDSDEGISIGECVKISRLIESNFDRDLEDYELRVLSPGLDQPFKLLRQYKKYLGKPVRVKTRDNELLKGVLIEVEEDYIELEVKKKKKEAAEKMKIFFNNIDQAKPEILFK
ncbi:MAG: ribosome assembly cofactor RimP [Bacteroidales bacterium]|nr:ribosome assembly cofactor RimP [Bacteroidales bacterium]MCF8404239.1 ribosome assembly cofactor RimP [Bacteroidales bacterium]